MKQLKQTHAGIINSICSLVIPALLLLLFAYTGASKLMGHSVFLNQLTKMEMLKSHALFISYFIPVIEITTAGLLMFSSLRTTGLLVSCVLMLLFTTFTAIILAGNQLPCRCGGVISKMNWTQHLFFNIAFSLLSITALWYHKSLHVYKGVSQKPSTE